MADAQHPASTVAVDGGLNCEGVDRLDGRLVIIFDYDSVCKKYQNGGEKFGAYTWS